MIKIDLGCSLKKSYAHRSSRYVRWRTAYPLHFTSIGELHWRLVDYIPCLLLVDFMVAYIRFNGYIYSCLPIGYEYMHTYIQLYGSIKSNLWYH